LTLYVAIISATAGVLGTVLGALGGYVAQQRLLSHNDRVAATAARQEVYVAFLDAVDILALDSTKWVQAGSNTATRPDLVAQTLRDRERLGPAIERVNLVASRQVSTLAGPLVDQANRVAGLASAPPADVATQMLRAHDAITAARGPFVERARAENQS
jgi:hypothetical protein